MKSQFSQANRAVTAAADKLRNCLDEMRPGIMAKYQFDDEVADVVCCKALGVVTIEYSKRMELIECNG